MQDLPENERAPKSTQALEAALAIIRGAGDEGIARTDLLEQVATIANVGRRTIEAVIDQEVCPHPQVIEKLLPGRGRPKGYKWREIGEDDGGLGGDADATPSATDLTHLDVLTQNPFALKQSREGRKNAISRNDAKQYAENTLREKTATKGATRTSGFTPSSRVYP